MLKGNVPKRTKWTQGQLDLMAMLIRNQIENNIAHVDWTPYLAMLGHDQRATIARAAMMRAEIKNAEDAKRHLAAAAMEAPTRAVKPVEGDAHVKRTSTQAYLFAAEMRARIGSQGITAGLLGDPPPGRSALDEKRGTAIAAVTQSRLREGRSARLPGVAARLSRELR